MTDKPKRAAVWIAVSSLEQAGEDKVSLDYQELECRRLAEERGYDVVDVLSVDGYSRSEGDLLTALDELRGQGVTAYDDIRRYWQTRSIDVLVVYTDSRLGRSPSLFTHVFDNLLSNHIEIDAVQGGLITYRDRRMRNAMGIVAITADQDRLRDQFQPAMIRRLEEGKPVTMKDTFTHNLVRNAKGRVIGFEINEEHREIAQTMAQAIINRETYADVAKILGIKYGVKNKRGSPISHNDVYAIVHSAVSWGNLVWNAHGKRGIWVCDESVPLPDGMLMNRGTHESMWTGDTANALKEELRRRSTIIRGRAWPQKVSAFSGLLLCGFCGLPLHYHHTDKTVTSKRWTAWRGYICKTNYTDRQRMHNIHCKAERKTIKFSKIVETVSPAIERLFREQSLDSLLITDPQKPLKEDIDRLNKELKDHRKHAQQLMTDRAKTPTSLQSSLQEMIDDTGKQVARLQEELDQLQVRNRALERNTAIQRQMLLEYKDIDMVVFWALPEDRINQVLFAILGDAKFVVENAEVVRIAQPVG